eukprot:CAMPEP_0170078418 /NCGR_PEP_ID=MMETSP0019_2-20121128/15010_1 /TAXON_ID=98059 /ORGANISM="Dinobryon sp., Strain UTEXLB2267" /LENGTH=147 /DNA_ID=CAMNT_0010291277 /DNA_START=757 /DNA_END=1200 /DNA_ORIENTATION=-
MSEYELKYGDTKNFSLRVVRKDFEEYGGVYKVGDYDRQDHESKLKKDSKKSNTTLISSGYYMHTMNKKKTPCLSSYLPVDATVLDGKAITMDNRVMYLVRNGTKCVFPDYDTFLAMKFDVHYVTRLEAAEFDSIPTGPQLQALDFPG